jgi:hypothetical protein
MFAWILIVSSWVSLLLLILHDATKEEGRDGSAISRGASNSIVAFKNLIKSGYALFGRARKKARTLKGAPSWIAQGDRSKSPLNGEATVEHTAPIAPQIRPDAPAAANQARGIWPPVQRWWRADDRIAITVPELELTITEAVRKAAPTCEGLVGVIIQQTKPKSRSEPNWSVQGIKFGRADRKVAHGALAGVVERMQKEFRVAEH